MLQCFVKGCKQTQVAAGTKLQDHDLNLEPVHSSTFLPFSLLHITVTAVTFSKDKPCKSLVSVGNGFLSTDSVYRSLLKISWQENLMILSTGWLKKFKVYHWTWTKLFLREKKQAKTMEWTWSIAHHVLSSDGLIIQLDSSFFFFARGKTLFFPDTTENYARLNLPTVCSPRSETRGREFPYYKTVLWIRPIVRIFGMGKCKLIANFSATMWHHFRLSLFLSLSLSLSLSLTERTSRTI